jgi:hypothetical protein
MLWEYVRPNVSQRIVINCPYLRPDPKYDPLKCFPFACPFLPLATGIFYVLTVLALVFFGALSLVAGILCCIPWKLGQG